MSKLYFATTTSPNPFLQWNVNRLVINTFHLCEGPEGVVGKYK